ncbi:phage tail protein [Streptomyces sp. NPDC001941]|uniref:phage tail protein n=1 Tax=Streptomyces sp. NPDC001941 TaxID=3154659 RepID=UPI003320F793
MTASAGTAEFTYPVPLFAFSVDFGGEEGADLHAGGVSGLEPGGGAGPHSAGGTFRIHTRPESPEVAFTRCRLAVDGPLYEWISGFSPTSGVKQDLTISLTDETGKNLLVTWDLVDAFPAGVGAVSVDDATGEASVESLVLRGDKLLVTAH